MAKSKKSKAKKNENIESALNADLSSLIDAAKSSLEEFNTNKDELQNSIEASEEVSIENLSKNNQNNENSIESIIENSNENLNENSNENLTLIQEETIEASCRSESELSDEDFAGTNLEALGETTDEGSNLASEMPSELIMEETTKLELKDGSLEEPLDENDEMNPLSLDTSSEELNLDQAMEDWSEGESQLDSLESEVNRADIQDSELAAFDSASIEELEFVEETQLESILESILFATDRPVSLATIKQIFKGTNVTNARLKKAIENIQVEYAGGRRGVTLEEVGSGYQLRTKVDNMEFLRRSFKAKAFKLSGPALEVLAITAYKQPVIKAEIDEIRGVESGHLLRALMEKNLVLFAGKSDLPGKPMQYGTTRKFLEIFGLRNLKELPTLSQIDELLPEGIGDEVEKPKLADITDGLSEKIGESYSEGEEELTKITDQLDKIDTSSEFFEKEKIRQKQEREAEKARNLREAIAVGETVSTRDLNWLKRYENPIEQQSSNEEDVVTPLDLTDVVAASPPMGAIDESLELEQALKDWDEEDANSGDLSISQQLEDNDLADIDEEI